MLAQGIYYYFNLVISFLCLVGLFSPVVIGYVIRRKCRLAAARKEEIKRLLVLASEEAARAELESSSGYNNIGAVSISSSPPYQCAVCYFPTTTRCAQCKAVRYCSGKCQIIHWRRGHKDECHPPSSRYQHSDDGSNSSSKAANQNQYGTYGIHSETEDTQHVKPVGTILEEPVFSNDSHASEVLCEKDSDIKVDFLADAKGTHSTSPSSSFSSGFFSSTSTGTSESSDDASVSESNDSNDLDKLDGYQSAGVATNMVETTASLEASQTEPLSAELNSAVYSSTSSTKSNQIKPGSNDGETQHRPTSSSGLSINESKRCSVAEPLIESNGFWEGALNSNWPRKDGHDDSTQFISREASAKQLSDSKSTLRFSFNLSGSTIPSLHLQQGSGINTNVSDDTHTTSLGINKAFNGDAPSKKIDIDARKVEYLPSSRSERSIHIDDNPVTDSHALRRNEVRQRSSSGGIARLSLSTDRESTSAGDLKVANMPSLRSKKSNHVVNGTSNTSHLLKSREAGSLSSTASDGRSPSSKGGHSVPSVKTEKVDSVHATGNISTQIANNLPNASNGLKTSVRKVVDQLRASKLSKNSLLGDECETAGRYSDKGLFPYELFIKLYAWNKVELLPCGLTNCGNSCYANVVLQCLAFTPPFTAYLLQGIHSKTCVNKEWCFTCEFESLILKGREGNSPMSPIGILSQLQNSGSHLGNGREEDAHEFLRYVIDKMQSSCLKDAGVNASGSLKEETTLLGLTFGGYLRSKIKCMKCQGKSERHERIMDLTVEIEGDIGTLEEALQQFTRTEILDGENKYHCSRCKSYEKAKKKLKISEAPNVLTIALKRFQSGKFGKLNKSIDFPEILNLAKYMSGTSDKSPIYRLYGVVVHLDIMNASFSGHYVCYVKSNQNKWFKIDDSVVKAVELKKVKEKGAYMLLYARCSPRAPRLLRNRIPRAAKTKLTMAKSGFPSAIPSVVHSHPSSTPLDGQYRAGLESIDSRHPMRTILEVDSSSDSSSLFSSCSDEGSCSTESTRDSISTDDISDYIFGDTGRGLTSPWRTSSDSDTSSSSSSPLYARHSPLADLDRYASGPHETSTSGSRIDYEHSVLEGDGLHTRLYNGGSRLEDLEGKGSSPFLHSDMTKQNSRKLASSSSSSSNSCGRDNADLERLGRVSLFGNVKFGASRRRSSAERTNC